MYRVDVIYDDQSVFTLDGVGQHAAIGMLKDALNGTLTDDEKDVIGLHVSVVPLPDTENREV